MEKRKQRNLCYYIFTAVILVCPVQCFKAYTEDKKYYATNEGLVRVPIFIPVSAKQVNLETNEITELTRAPFRHLRQLSSLLLSDNKISRVQSRAFSDLAGLLTLDLTNNELTSIRADMWVGLDNLRFLSLRGNNLTTIPAHAFHNLGLLSRLNLSRNNLAQIRAKMWTGLDSLEILYLEWNRITYIETRAFMDFPKNPLIYTVPQKGH